MQEVEDIFEDVLPKETDTPQDQPQEKEAPSGYMSKEAWTAAGKNPNEWVTEDVFKERTLRIKNEQRLNRLRAEERADFDRRIKNLNLLSQAQLDRQKQELLSRRDDAIDVADKATVRRIDKEIEAIDKQSELVADKKDIPPKPPEIAEWEEENPWIFDESDPKREQALAIFEECVGKGKTYAYALRAIDAEMKFSKKADVEYKKKPPISMADSSKSTQSSSDNVTLSWSQLSGEEAAMFDELFSHSGMSKKDYLKAVADQRRGAK